MIVAQAAARTPPWWVSDLRTSTRGSARTGPAAAQPSARWPQLLAEGDRSPRDTRGRGTSAARGLTASQGGSLPGPMLMKDMGLACWTDLSRLAALLAHGPPTGRTFTCVHGPGASGKAHIALTVAGLSAPPSTRRVSWSTRDVVFSHWLIQPGLQRSLGCPFTTRADTVDVDVPVAGDWCFCGRLQGCHRHRGRFWAMRNASSLIRLWCRPGGTAPDEHGRQDQSGEGDRRLRHGHLSIMMVSRLYRIPVQRGVCRTTLTDRHNVSSSS